MLLLSRVATCEAPDEISGEQEKLQLAVIGERNRHSRKEKNLVRVGSKLKQPHLAIQPNWPSRGKQTLDVYRRLS